MSQKFFAINASQHDIPLIITSFPAGVLVSISYAAIRNKDAEEGSVQRVLNTSRINSIKNFAINNGNFPNAIVLNWVSESNPLTMVDQSISFRNENRSAQIIDGQHRLAGIKAAIEERKDLKNLSLPTVIYKGLTTKQCADIFLSINTEQKPVPKSLVYDLFGIASKVEDTAALRARDIAVSLNEGEDSPFQGVIKFPGSPLRKGGVSLSTVVSGIKPLVEQKGLLESGGVSELEMQRKSIANLFRALRSKYGSAWGSADNAFLAAAGFMAAMKFFRDKIVPYCVQKRNFSEQIMSAAISLSKTDLIYRRDFRGLGGTAAMNSIYDKLVGAFAPDSPPSDAIEF